MRRLELDIGFHTIENSLTSNMTLCPYVLNSHSVNLVAKLAFPVFCSHFEAKKKMLLACSASTSAFNCNPSLPTYLLLMPCRHLFSFCYTVYKIHILVHDSGYLRWEGLCGEYNSRHRPLNFSVSLLTPFILLISWVLPTSYLRTKRRYLIWNQDFSLNNFPKFCRQ